MECPLAGVQGGQRGEVDRECPADAAGGSACPQLLGDHLRSAVLGERAHDSASWCPATSSFSRARRSAYGRASSSSPSAVVTGAAPRYVMFTRSLLDAPRRLVDVQVLSPLAVMPELHKRGIGSALVRHGLGVLAERAAPLVFLEGDPGYYSRFGFAPGGGLGFRKPSLRIPDGAFQVIRFPEHEPWMTGTSVCAEPFWRHDAVGLRDPNA